MIRKCKICGTEFVPQTGDRYLCSECYAKKMSENAYRRVKCWQCGKEFDGRIRSRYCPDCAAERQRERDRQRRKTGAARKLGSIDHCEICGAEYVVVSGRQRYCPTCAEEEKKKYAARMKREWYDAGGKQKRDASRARLKTDATVCPVCGKAFTASSEHPHYCSRECADIAANSDTSYRVINRDPAAEKLNARNKTGVRGVHLDSRSGKYVAKITVNNMRHILGYFATLDDAAKARHDAEILHYGRASEASRKGGDTNEKNS